MADYICHELSLTEAARRLGVSTHEAQRLARTGRLQIVGTVGQSVLVDDASVLARQRTSHERGRRWSSNTAWASIELLQHGSTTRLVGTTLSRQRARLRRTSQQVFVRRATTRATAFRCTQTRRTRDALGSQLLLTGTTALDDAATASQLGLATGAGPTLTGYVHAPHWDELRERYGLVSDAEGDVVIRVSEHEALPGLITIALDLIDRGATREKDAGEVFLADALARFAAHRDA